MSDPDRPAEDPPQVPATPAAPTPPVKAGPGYPDLMALGIGCLIFVIFFGAIVIAAVTRE